MRVAQITVAVCLAVGAFGTHAKALTDSTVVDGDASITTSLEDNIWSGIAAFGGKTVSISAQNNGTLFIRDETASNQNQSTIAVRVAPAQNAASSLIINGNLDIDVANSTNSSRSFWIEGDTVINGNIHAVSRALGSSNLAEALVLRGSGQELTIDGELTHLVAVANGGRTLGVENFATGGGVINFNADRTVIEAITTSDSANFAQGILAYQSTTNFKGDAEIRVEGGMEAAYGIDVQCDPGNPYDTTVNIAGNARVSVKGTREVYAIRPSGVPGTIFVGGNADVSAYSIEKTAYGIRSIYGALARIDGNLSVVSKSDANDAVALSADVYTGYAGTVIVGGAFDATVEAEGFARGIVLNTTGANVEDGDGIVSIGQNTRINVSGTSASGIQATGSMAVLRLEGDTEVLATSTTGEARGILVEDGADVVLTGANNRINVESRDGYSEGIAVGSGHLLLSGMTTVEGGDVGLSIFDADGQVELSENAVLYLDSVQNKGRLQMARDSVLDVESTADALNMLGNITAEGATLALGGGTFSANSVQGVDNTILLTDLANTKSVSIMSRTAPMTFSASSSSNDQYASAEATLNALANALNVETTAEGLDRFVVEEGKVNNGLSGDIDSATGEISNVTVQKNTTVDALGSLAVLKTMQWRHELSSLEDRMASLRSGDRVLGAWGRLYGSEMEYGAQSLISKNTSVELGFDADVTDRWSMGVSVSYTDGSSSYDHGRADQSAFGLGLYGTWSYENALYVDLIAKYNRLSSDFHINGVGGSSDNNALGVSAELGWHIPVLEKAFIEPIVTVTYGRIVGDDYSLDNEVKLSEQDVDSLIAGAGIRMGFDFPNDAGRFFAKAQLLREFQGDVKAVASTEASQNQYDFSVQDTFVEFGLGAAFRLSGSTESALSIERSTNSTVKEGWRWNLSLRHEF